jgi:hypothetical protein
MDNYNDYWEGYNPYNQGTVSSSSGNYEYNPKTGSSSGYTTYMDMDPYSTTYGISAYYSGSYGTAYGTAGLAQ